MLVGAIFVHSLDSEHWVGQLVSSFTSSDSTASLQTNDNIFSLLVKSSLVELETTVQWSLSPMVRGLWLGSFDDFALDRNGGLASASIFTLLKHLHASCLKARKKKSDNFLNFFDFVNRRLIWIKKTYSSFTISWLRSIKVSSIYVKSNNMKRLAWNMNYLEWLRNWSFTHFSHKKL